MKMFVRSAGFLTSVQDQGRTGFRQSGISVGGALDSHAMRVANALVGTVFPTRENPKLASYLPTFNHMVGKCAGLRRAGPIHRARRARLKGAVRELRGARRVRRSRHAG